MLMLTSTPTSLVISITYNVYVDIVDNVNVNIVDNVDNIDKHAHTAFEQHHIC